MEKTRRRVLFTKKMKKDYTIIAPSMAPIHFSMLDKVFIKHGYRFVMLDSKDADVVEFGLQNVHNDTCYPALLIAGQFVSAFKNGRYDPNKTAVMITQTGGGCRASNYIFLIRRALAANGYGQVPVISLSVKNMEKNPGFKLNPSLLIELIYAVLYGDLLMLLSNQTLPYEQNKGDTNALLEKWIKELDCRVHTFYKIRRNLKHMVLDFKAIPLMPVNKVKVGIVGEIFVKYSPLANNNLEEFLRREDAEVVIPGLLDFLIYCCDHWKEDRKYYGIKSIKQIGSVLAENLLKYLQKLIKKAVEKHSDFRSVTLFDTTKSYIKGYLSPANKMGEGWLLTAEMLELIHEGVENIICAQPFGCLPNHIVGKGMIKKIRKNHPASNIVAIDYDPSATRINQENRIKLMLATAKEKLEDPSLS